jgi:hypothetical protein
VPKYCERFTSAKRYRQPVLTNQGKCSVVAAAGCFFFFKKALGWSPESAAALGWPALRGIADGACADIVVPNVTASR